MRAHRVEAHTVAMTEGMPAAYAITIKGHLDDHWSDWFEGLTITNGANGEAVLAGPLVDQAALHGVLIKIRDLGLPLLSVRPVGAEAGERESVGDIT